jgi:hypothetical protein
LRGAAQGRALGSAWPPTRAKALLAQTDRAESVASVAAAAVLFTVSALALAVTVVTLPPHWSN